VCSVGSWRQELDSAFDPLAFDNRVDGVGGNIPQSLDAAISQRISALPNTESPANPKCKRGSLVEKVHCGHPRDFRSLLSTLYGKPVTSYGHPEHTRLGMPR
jgi:hypothetical protein